MSLIIFFTFLKPVKLCNIFFWCYVISNTACRWNSQHRQLWELQTLHLSILARCITLQSIFKYLSAISPELTGLIWITTGSLCSLFVFLQKCTYLQSTPKHWNAPSSARDLAEHLLIPCLITVGLRSFLLSSIRVRPILCFLNKCQTIFRNLFQGACWTSLEVWESLGNNLAFFPITPYWCIKRIPASLCSHELSPGVTRLWSFQHLFFSSWTLISTRLRDKCKLTKAVEAVCLWNFLSAVLK